MRYYKNLRISHKRVRKFNKKNIEMSDQNKSNHQRPIPPIALPNSIPPYNQVSNIFSRLGQSTYILNL